MRRTARLAATVAAACTMVGIASSSAQADDANAGIYTGWNQVGYCDGTYYYWSSNGNGTTRDVDLSFAEDHHVTLRCLLGHWQGTPTSGIIWDSCDHMREWVRTWT